MSASATATAGGTPVVSDVRLIAISVSDAVPVAPQRSTMPKSRIALEKLPSKKYLTAPSVLSGSRFANPARRYPGMTISSSAMKSVTRSAAAARRMVPQSANRRVAANSALGYPRAKRWSGLIRSVIATIAAPSSPR